MTIQATKVPSTTFAALSVREMEGLNKCEASLDDNVEDVFDQLADAVKRGILQFYDKVYIVDTKTLVASPAILSRLSEKDLIVLPKKVLDELDAQKSDHDETQQWKVRRAMRTVKKLLMRPNIRIEAGGCAMNEEPIEALGETIDAPASSAPSSLSFKRLDVRKLQKQQRRNVKPAS